ncbi:MAG: dihydropteroate synthase, partial [Candidatus Eremiobacteraeota bacterium]|nr:dihydropteroate synthase [Candidatus Eremiobacteraeota bacterium]
MNGAAVSAGRVPLVTRERRFAWGERTYLMGVINVTPDSFSGDGRPAANDALALALELDAAGADVLDLGAESTRPGALPIDVEEEGRRLLPALSAIRAALPHAVLSVDTYKPAIFRQAREAGGDWLNSVWGLDDGLLASAAQHHLPVVIMHNQRVAQYDDVVGDVLRYLEGQA